MLPQYAEISTRQVIESDDCEFDDMPWTEPQNSKTQVNKAGKLVRDTDPDAALFPIGWNDAVTVIDNWRASHGYPLQVIYMRLRERSRIIARRSKTKALVTQRRKRFESIHRKLRLRPNMALTQMQDIGGCRAVMRSMREVDRLINLYERDFEAHADNRPELAERYDYIRSDPKATGYRSMHYVLKYRGSLLRRACYAGMRVEVQIRSQLQHAWATAVETVDTITLQALKSNVGDDDWKRFFALMGSALALRERTPLIPGTPENRRELYDELTHYSTRLKIEDVLSGYGTAVFEMIEPQHGAEVFLLELDPSAKNIRVTSYTAAERLQAEHNYAEAERNLDRDKGQQAVLVSAESIDSLKRAYPNYFLDTRMFLNALARTTLK